MRTIATSFLVVFATLFQQVVITHRTHYHAFTALGSSFVNFANGRLEGTVRRSSSVENRQRVTQQRFRRHHHQRTTHPAQRPDGAAYGRPAPRTGTQTRGRPLLFRRKVADNVPDARKSTRPLALHSRVSNASRVPHHLAPFLLAGVR